MRKQVLDELSDDAIKLWLGHFPTGRRSTLRFGGDHAKMEITPWARSALNELLAVGAVAPTEPDDSWPNREHYRGTDIDLRPIAVKRAGGKPSAVFDWLEKGSTVTFRTAPQEGE